MLSPEQQHTLLQIHATGEATQEELAQLYGVSRWYVRKLILQAKNLVLEKPHLSFEDSQLLQVARATGLNPEQLQQILQAPQLTDRNIFQWLVRQPMERLARLFLQVVLTQQTPLQDTHHAEPETGRAS